MSNPNNPDYAAIRRRADAATPGPWEYLSNPSFYVEKGSQVRTGSSPHVRIAADLSVEDAEFIAQAPTDIPALLADIEQWRTLSEKQLLQIALLSGERDRLQAKLDAALLANQKSGDPTSFLQVRDALTTDIGELVPTWPCMECGNPIRFRENTVLGGARFQHLEEPDFPHFPVRGPQKQITPIEGEAR